jgi:ubiquinone/menaquinone biosynthesis C-methylase UbiE
MQAHLVPEAVRVICASRAIVEQLVLSPPQKNGLPPIAMKADSKLTYKDGQAYERWMGRWSRLTGRQFLDWLQIPQRQRWLDVGCGTGALTEAILSYCDPELVVAFDSSEQQLAYARSRIDDKRLTFRIGDATSIDANSNSFDVAASALVLNFIADQRKAMDEMIKVVRPGGVVAVYVWDFAGRRNITQHLSDAIAAVAPDAERTARIAQQADTTKPGALAQLFRSVGLETIETTSLDIVAEYVDFDDYWISNTSLVSPVSIIGTAGGSLATTQIEALKQRLREYLPADGNGKISFAARAWAARGSVPSQA